VIPGPNNSTLTRGSSPPLAGVLSRAPPRIGYRRSAHNSRHPPETQHEEGFPDGDNRPPGRADEMVQVLRDRATAHLFRGLQSHGGETVPPAPMSVVQTGQDQRTTDRPPVVAGRVQEDPPL
jgi:hypothetical protein